MPMICDARTNWGKTDRAGYQPRTPVCCVDGVLRISMMTEIPLLMVPSCVDSCVDYGADMRKAVSRASAAYLLLFSLPVLPPTLYFRKRKAMQLVRHLYLRGTMLALLPLALVAVGADAVELQGWEAKVEIQGQRFIVLREFNSEAVLDNETQLVWERSPSPTGAEWTSAPMRCAIKSVGGRKGWRLPSFYELMSLVDPSVKAGPASPRLPNGHPFRDVKAAPYWSGTTYSHDPASAYAVDFFVGDIALHGKSGIRGYWCVTGGSSGQDRHLSDDGHQVVFPGPFKMLPQLRHDYWSL